jgi:hypothetical protein
MSCASAAEDGGEWAAALSEALNPAPLGVGRAEISSGEYDISYITHVQLWYEDDLLK